MDAEPAWRDRRREDLAAHAAALERRREAEVAQARALLDTFVQEMTARGVAPERLRARVPDGRRPYRTNVTGWYLRRNGALGVGTDGSYYVLETAPSVAARVFGVSLDSTDPPLIVGVGARDGESRPLEQLVKMRLDEY